MEIFRSEEEDMAREGFMVYHEMLDFLLPYSDEERGRILTAMLKYSIAGELPEFSGNERFVWPVIQTKIDKDREAYEAACERNRKNISKRYERIPEPTTVYDRIPPYTTEYDGLPNLPTTTTTTTTTETTTKQEQKKETAHARGEFGWVKLTDDQYEKLLKDLGQEELDRCIQYIDESAQQTGNKNKWKDWNLIIRKCSRDGWGKSWEKTNTRQTQTPTRQKTMTAAEYNSRPKQNTDLDELRRMIGQI